MGAVYRAHDLELDRDVALKFLTGDLTWADTAARDRFLHEARTASRRRGSDAARSRTLQSCPTIPR